MGQAFLLVCAGALLFTVLRKVFKQRVLAAVVAIAASVAGIVLTADTHAAIDQELGEAVADEVALLDTFVPPQGAVVTTTIMTPSDKSKAKRFWRIQRPPVETCVLARSALEAWMGPGASVETAVDDSTGCLLRAERSRHAVTLKGYASEEPGTSTFTLEVAVR